MDDSGSDDTIPIAYPAARARRGQASASPAGTRPPSPALAYRDLTRGSVPRNLWFLAWPQITEGFLGILGHVADLIWVGRLGFHVLAGLGVVQTYIRLVMTARMGLEIGMRAMIARAVGARRISLANHILLQALTVTALFGVAVITTGWLLAEPLLRVFGLSEDVVTQATLYLRIQVFSVAVWSFQSMIAGALQASGDSVPPLKAETMSRTVHLVLSPLLIFGWLGLPSLELAGVAAATFVSRSLGAGLNLYTLTSGSSRLRLDLRRYRPDIPLVWRLLKVGVPASVTEMQRGVSQLIVLGIVAPFGEVAVAAFAVARRAEIVSRVVSRGLGRAAGALAGQNLGANQPDRAKSTVRWALVFVTMGSLPLATLLLVFSSQVTSFVSNESEFVGVASNWLIIIALGYISLGVVQVFTMALNTSGQTLAPMIMTLATVWGVEIPLAFGLSQLTPLGQFGGPWAIVAAATIRLLAFAWYFGRGRWLRPGVI